MARTDTDDDRKILGSGHPETQEEARQDAIERAGGEDAYYGDPMTHWTSQQGGMPDTGTAAALGPQAYLQEQLPDPNVAKAAGITPQNVSALTVLDPDEAWGHPKGPEPGEQVRLLKNDATNQHMLDNTEAADREHFTLTSGSMADVRAAQEGGDAGGGDDGGEMTKAQLTEEARSLGVSGYSTMNKEELQAAVEEARG